MNEVIELLPDPAREVLETTAIEKEIVVEAARQGPPGPPGPSLEDTFDIDPVLLYQIAKL